MTIEQRLEERNITLPHPPNRAGLYRQSCIFGSNLVYVSGCGPDLEGVQAIKGKLGQDVDIPTGQLAARCCMLNALAILKRDLGDLNRIKRVVKLLAFVASDDAFYEQPTVANGASQLLVDLFGEEIGCPTRSAIGVNVLPGNIPVEIEMIVEIEE